MRAWDRAFRRASFRGARFWVESEDPQHGRRVAVHEISGGEKSVTEDMGRRASEFPVSAYVASDSADVEGLALEAACKAPGSSLLILPMDAPQLVHSLDCRRNRSKDRNGYIGYSLRFVEAGSGAMAGMSGLAALRGVFSAGVGEVASAVSGAFR